MKRSFSTKEKLAIFFASNGHCALCGKKLDTDWHADHIIPFSKGGSTDVTNGQALCPKCNLKKGACMLQYRDWQNECCEKYFELNAQDFLLMALPGAGKTICSLRIASSIPRSQIQKIIVVAPTSYLKSQWSKDAKQFFGLDLLTEFMPKDNIGHEDFHGICTTYQQVTINPHIFNKLCHMHGTFVIFDEIHHAGEANPRSSEERKNDWCTGIKEAFQNANRRLTLSGTPFRSDNKKIPFVRYEDNVCVPDFSYDYPRAVSENVIRLVRFDHYDGYFEWIDPKGEEKKASFSDKINKKDLGCRLNTATHSDENWVYELLTDADKKLEEIRSDEQTDAGGLVIAKSIFHAHTISKHRVFQNNTTIVASDDPEAKNKIESFRASKQKWLIAVNMISEGVDIKRLRVLAYLTNVTTELYFRQAIGRIIRYSGFDDYMSYCFLPSDPRFVEYANNIKESQIHAIQDEDPGTWGPGPGGDNGESQFDPLRAENARLESVSLEGDTLDTKILEKIKPYAEKYKIDPALAVSLFQDMGYDLTSNDNQDDRFQDQQIKTLEDEIKDIKRKITKKASKLTYILRCEFGDIHKKWLDLGGKLHKHNDLDDLKAKYEWLKKEVNKHANQ